MKASTVLATVASAVAAAGAAAVCLVYMDRFIKLCDETRKDAQLCFGRAVNARSEKAN